MEGVFCGASICVESEDTHMVKVVSFLRNEFGGFDVFVRGEHYGWARMADTAAELAGVALIDAF